MTLKSGKDNGLNRVVMSSVSPDSGQHIFRYVLTTGTRPSNLFSRQRNLFSPSLAHFPLGDFQ